MENIESVLEETVNSSDDKTSENENNTQPSVEQLNAEILKWKNMAERRGNQLEKMKASLSETEVKTSESIQFSKNENYKSVDTAPLATETKSAYNTNSVDKNTELEMVKEELFRVKHPEITDEDMSVLKSINSDFNSAYENIAFQSYMESQKTLRANANATISQESGVNIKQDLSNDLEKVDKENLSDYIVANANKFFN